MATQGQIDKFNSMSPEEQAALTNYINALRDEVRRIYPQYAWTLDIPDLADVLIQAAAEKWDDGRTIAALQNTQWWKDRNNAQRAQEQLYRNDPGTWNQQKNATKTAIRQFASRNGITISDAEAEQLAFNAVTGGKSTEEWQASLVQTFMGGSGARGQTPAPIADRLKQIAADYAVPLSGETLKKWASDILTGMVDENTFASYVREQAKSMFPSLSNAIDRGITVKQYVDPYSQIAQTELGINPNDIDWADQKWSRALHNIDAKSGAPVSMSLSDWTRELRTNPVYGFDQTIRAQEQAGQLGNAMLQRLGYAA